MSARKMFQPRLGRGFRHDSDESLDILNATAKPLQEHHWGRPFVAPAGLSNNTFHANTGLTRRATLSKREHCRAEPGFPFFQNLNCTRQPKGETMKRKELTLALGFFTLLLLIGVASSPILKNEKWWISWWVCEYADGTLVYHQMRPERTWQNAFDNFDGRVPGDCDAFMVIAGIEHYVCTDSVSAEEMKRRHGPIMNVRKQTPPPHRPPDKTEVQNRE